MTATTDLLDRWKDLQRIETDYRAAKVLGVTRSAVSSWRHEAHQMSPTTALRIAEDLGLDPWPVIAQLHAETLDPKPEAARWRRYCARVCVAVLATFALTATPNDDSAQAHLMTYKSLNDVHIMRTPFWRAFVKRFAAWLTAWCDPCLHEIPRAETTLAWAAR